MGMIASSSILNCLLMLIANFYFWKLNFMSGWMEYNIFLFYLSIPFILSLNRVLEWID